MKVIEKFLEYVKMDTQSSAESGTTPSTPAQHELAKLLYRQLGEMGAKELVYDQEHCYLYATVPASCGREQVPVVGLIAHMDTSPAVTGKNVKPRIVEHYDGGDIILNREKNIVMKVSDFPELASYEGKSLIVTGGIPPDPSGDSPWEDTYRLYAG